MKFRVGCATDIGRKRSQNQDSVTSNPELGLFVVADGMGGHRGGETASKMVVDLVPQYIKKAQSSRGWSAREAISRAIGSANSAIFDRARREPELEGMGTTTVALLFQGDTLTIGHVGDSRCYMAREGGLWQATRDHSWVQEKMRAGLITRDQMKSDRNKNVITRSVGFESDVQVEIYEVQLRAGDVFLLCSDGLSGLVDDAEIRAQVERYRADPDPETAVRSMIAAANANGGDDNISTILVEVLA